MKVYKVVENFQNSDTDDWYQFKGTTEISYHKTKDGAMAKVKSLISLPK